MAYRQSPKGHWCAVLRLYGFPSRDAWTDAYALLVFLAAVVQPAGLFDPPDSRAMASPPRDERSVAHRGRRAGEKKREDLSLRIGVQTPEGILVVYDAAMPPDHPRAAPGLLAYWRDFETRLMYVYGRLLFTPADVGQALLNLDRDLGIDPEPMAGVSSALEEAMGHAALQDEDETQWGRATDLVVLGLMRFEPSAGTDFDPVFPDEGTGGAAGIPDRCPVVMATGPLDPPPGAVPTPREVMLRVLEASGLQNGTVAAPVCWVPYWAVHCDDYNPCTTDWCEECYCLHEPAGDEGWSCPDDGNPCTDDVCAGRTCTHPPNDDPCEDDGDPCTDDVCDNGNCVHRPNTGAPCEDDGDPCTDDVCDNGSCVHPPNSGAPCEDDGNPCTLDICRTGVCKHEPISGPQCEDDGDMCTDDVCVEGACTHPAKTCGQGNPCVTYECIPCVGCVSTSCCDDGNPCTHNICDPDASNPCLTCEFPDMFPPPPQEETCWAQGCSIGWSGTPSVMFVNDDDDNENGVPDYLEEGPVDGEDDLVRVTVGYEGCPPPACDDPKLTALWSLGPVSGGSYRFYRNRYKTEPIEPYSPKGKKGEAWPPPPELWVEARETTGPCGVPLRLRIWCGKNECVRQSGRIKVVKVASLQWEQHAVAFGGSGCTLAEGNLGLSRCPNNGGVQIFPGKIDPQDGDAELRRQIDLVARIEPRISGVTVRFKIWDVDDPFNELHPDMPDVSVIDPNDGGGPLGGDNRGGNGGNLGYATNSYGQARATITVSLYPGDNYRAIAVLDLDTRNQVSQADADALNLTTDKWGNTQPNGGFCGYKVPVVWSKMLTVWRKLWIERDTMRAPQVSEITVTGTVGAITPNAPVPGQATIDLGQNLADEFSDLNLYEEGRIVFVSCPAGQDTFPILESTSNLLAHDEVIVIGVPGPCANGSVYTLYDDDDPSVLPHYPDGGQLLFEAFSDAYILPEYASPAYQDVLGFDMHVGDWDAEYGWGPWDDGQDLTSSTSFWSCLVVGCWESGQNEDADPDYCFMLTPPFVARAGAEAGTTGKTDDDSGASMIFLQAIADDAGCTFVTDEAHTVTHEIAHTCGSHGQHIADTMMEEGAPRTQNNFAAESVKIFREQDAW